MGGKRAGRWGGGPRDGQRADANDGATPRTGIRNLIVILPPSQSIRMRPGGPGAVRRGRQRGQEVFRGEAGHGAEHATWWPMLVISVVLVPWRTSFIRPAKASAR